MRDAHRPARPPREERPQEGVSVASAASPEELHRVTIKLKSVERAQRFGELLHRGAINVFDATALGADRVVMVMCRLAKHERRLTLSVGSLGYIAFRPQTVERAIDR